MLLALEAASAGMTAGLMTAANAFIKDYGFWCKLSRKSKNLLESNTFGVWEKV
jgi:hypothetical protein